MTELSVITLTTKHITPAIITENEDPTKDAFTIYIPALDLSCATSLVMRCENPKDEKA